MRPNPIAGVLSLAVVVTTSGCALPADTSAAPANHVQLVQKIGIDSPVLPLAVSYRNLMTGMVGSAGYELFELYNGNEPLTADDWRRAGQAAADLAALSSLLSIEGRGESDRRRYDDPKWRQLVVNLRNASIGVASAAESRDQKAFVRYVEVVGDTSQTCHAQFQKLRTAPPRDLAETIPEIPRDS